MLDCFQNVLILIVYNDGQAFGLCADFCMLLVVFFVFFICFFLFIVGVVLFFYFLLY